MKLTIIDNNIEKNELSKNAMGGTELMQHELHKRVDKDLLDQFQIICSRVRDLKTDKKRILWCHDLAGDPEVAFLKDGGYDNFDKIVFVSYWQQQQYANFLGVPYSKGIVLQNAINSIPVHEKPKDIINLVYFSTPHRGLDILVPVFENLHENVFKTLDKEVHLHVYSSFKLYGWEQRDREFKELFDRCKQHPFIHYHGSVSNDTIKNDLQKMHILAYPNTWPETSCIVLMEAMSAKLICVHSSLAALPETSANWTIMYPFVEDKQQHAGIFARNLVNAVMLHNNDSLSQRLDYQKSYTDAFYNWDIRAMQWDNLLREVVQ